MAYRRATQIAAVLEGLGEIAESAEEKAEKAKVPKTLGRMVRNRLKDDPTLSWDDAVTQIVKKSKGRKSDTEADG